ncbi:hypothetical protein [Effusibacillus pohliae]|uniref:hypothetical protein n=1 Tax=Effusibacillus pohliae TaxID=232270 RepID=UPI00036486C5|nr:hypothetical protein [Effusibacillus pohliae]
MDEIKNPLQKDLKTLVELSQAFYNITLSYEQKKPVANSKRFWRDFRKNIELHLGQLVHLLNRSVSVHYHTEFGLLYGALFDRVILTKKMGWALLLEVAKTRNGQLFDEADRLHDECERLAELVKLTLESIAQKLEEGPTQNESGPSALVGGEIKDGGTRGTT